jgi:regulator of replication initiation timing
MVDELEDANKRNNDAYIKQLEQQISDFEDIVSSKISRIDELELEFEKLQSELHHTNEQNTALLKVVAKYQEDENRAGEQGLISTAITKKAKDDDNHKYDKCFWLSLMIEHKKLVIGLIGIVIATIDVFRK